MGVFTGSDTDTVRLECLSDSRVTDNIIRSSGLLDEPRLDGLEDLHVLDSLGDVPDLYSGLAKSSKQEARRTVGIHHQDTSGRPGVLALDRRWADGFSVLGDVFWVVDDFTDQHASSQIVMCVGSDLELQPA